MLALVELCYSAIQIWSNVISEDNLACTLSVLFYLAFGLLATFLNLCIAINLAIVFVFERQYPNLFQWYLFGSVIAALGFSLPPLFIGLYGFELTEQSCWIKYPTTTTTLMWKIISFYGPTGVSVLTTAILTAAVLRKLHTVRRRSREEFPPSPPMPGPPMHVANEKEPPSPSSTGSSPSPRGYQYPNRDLEFHGSSSAPPRPHGSPLKKLNTPSMASPQQQNVPLVVTADEVLNRLASRIIFYPLIPLLAQLFNTVSDMDAYANRRQHYTLLLISYIGTSIQGTFTALVFFTLDPAFSAIYREIRKAKTERNHEDDDAAVAPAASGAMHIHSEEYDAEKQSQVSATSASASGSPAYPSPSSPSQRGGLPIPMLPSTSPATASGPPPPIPGSTSTNPPIPPPHPATRYLNNNISRGFSRSSRSSSAFRTDGGISHGHGYGYGGLGVTGRSASRLSRFSDITQHTVASSSMAASSMHATEALVCYYM
ncbi:hypothetical protein HK102_009742 [Quaeritorhiza haematococci]|nr:hypothetical protein HK102_009742 [Quaeritorhiza haematococci]